MESRSSDNKLKRPSDSRSSSSHSNGSSSKRPRNDHGSSQNVPSSRSRTSSSNTSRSSSSKPRSKPAPPAPALQQQTNNLLNKESEFICKMKFRNTLPDIPFDPKLLPYPFDPMRYINYTPTSLENTYQHVILTEPNLGVPINLIDPEAYRINPSSKLHPEDASLLTAYDQASNSKTPKRRMESLRPTVSWLRKTEYMSNELSDEFKKKKENVVESTYGLSAQKREQEEGGKKHKTIEETIQAIQEGFEMSKELPVHPTDPTLKAVEILPLLPDFDRWPNTYTQVIFDADPTPRSEELGMEIDIPLDSRVTDDLMKKGVIKGISSFVTYMVPAPTEGEGTSGGDEGEDEMDYKWVREYHYRVREDHRNSFFFVWGKDEVLYNEIGNKVLLEKIKSKEAKEAIKRELIEKKGRPRKIILRKRELVSDEIEQREERNKTLEG